jgi:uncharacterized protein YbjT (DUF2867 family)
MSNWYAAGPSLSPSPRNIPPAFLPNEADVGKAVVEAATEAGVRHFVFSSVIHPILSGLAKHIHKAPVEEAVLTSGMEYTFLRKNASNWKRG